MNIEKKQPDHLRAYAALRSAILGGDLSPGQAVTIHGLGDITLSGMTPTREAIRRLISEGALELKGNRRVCVPELTPAAIDEIAFARLALEPQLAFWAAEKVTEPLIADLQAIDSAVDRALDDGNVADYMRHNSQFHMTLYDAAERSSIVQIVQALWLRIGPSFRVICGRVGTGNLPDMHKQAIAGLKEENPQAVMDAIHADIEQGITTIRAAIDPQN